MLVVVEGVEVVLVVEVDPCAEADILEGKTHETQRPLDINY